MIDLAIVVEGPTEERFVQRVLVPALWTRNISAWPVLPGQGEHRRGGRWPWASVRRDVANLLKQRADRYCSILFDYYALPDDWPGRPSAPRHPMSDRGRVVEEALHADVTGDIASSFQKIRFIPHIQLHEYEARLFSNCDALAAVLGIDARPLRQIVADCGGPEQINDDVESAPSKRLDQLCREIAFRGYRKTTEGVTAAERVTLDAMKSACPHFRSWLTRVESLVPLV